MKSKGKLCNSVYLDCIKLWERFDLRLLVPGSHIKGEQLQQKDHESESKKNLPSFLFVVAEHSIDTVAIIKT